MFFRFFSLPVVTVTGFLCLSSHQPCFQWLSRYWQYFPKPLKSDKTALCPWYFSWKKMRSIIFKNILLRAIYCTEMLTSPLFLLKLEILKKMETQIQNQGIKFNLRFLLYFCVAKCYSEWKLSKNGSNGFQIKGKALRNSCIFVNVVFMKLCRYLFSRIQGFCGYFWQMDLKKIMIFVWKFLKDLL